MEVEYLSVKRITALHLDEFCAAAEEVVRSGRYLRGQHVAHFEEQYAAYTGQQHCISCGNGLDALTIMLRAYKELGVLCAGDEIVVPANTFIATILAITENGLVPVLVEPRLQDYQIDDALIEKALTHRTRAIMLVHLYGYNALTEKIASLCRRHHLLLLQDCAQAHGWHKVCSLPRHDDIRGAAAYSFYPGKNLAAFADAGAITTSDGALAAVARALANYGAREKYVFTYQGRNSRMDEMSAAILSIKLKYLDEENRRRQEIADYYIDHIRHDGLLLPPREGVHHIFPILFSERDRLRAYLRAEGVETLVHYPLPPHRQDCYKEYNALSLPRTERIAREELSLPLHQALRDDEVEHVVAAINRFV